MKRTERQTAIGRRMRLAAEEIRLSKKDAARRLGVAESTVHRWWDGSRCPDESDMERYAALVFMPVEWLWTGHMPKGEEAHRSYLQAEASRNGSRASVEALQQQIEEKRAALSRLVREAALAEGEEIRAARYQVQKELQEEIRALTRQIEPAEAAAASDLPALIEEMIPIAAGMAEEWPSFPGPLKQALVRAFIQSVPVELGESRHGVRRPFRVLPVVWQPWAEED